MKKLLYSMVALLLLVASNAQAIIKFEYKEGGDSFGENLFDLTNVHFIGDMSGNTIFGTVKIGSNDEFVKFVSNEPIKGSEEGAAVKPLFSMLMRTDLTTFKF